MLLFIALTSLFIIRISCRFSNDDGSGNVTGNADQRRIVDLKYFLTELKNISSHSSAFGCGINNIQLIGEQRLGLCSKLKFQCNMCNVKLFIDTSEHSPTANLNLNTAVITSAATGVGYIRLQEIFASMITPANRRSR